MAIPITLRRVKGSILTADEMDDNLVSLQTGAQQGIDDAQAIAEGLGTISSSNLTISTSDPSGTASEGDIWLKIA